MKNYTNQIIVTIVIALFSSTVFCQRPIYPTHVTDFVQGYGQRLLTTPGSGLIADLGFSNPAGIVELESYGLGLQYQVRSELKHPIVDNLKFPEERIYLPKSAAAGVALKKFSLGVCYNQEYDISLTSVGGEIRTVAEPEGTGENFEFGESTRIDRFSLLGGRVFQAGWTEFTLSLALKISYDDTFIEQYIWNEKNQERLNQTSLSYGAILNHPSKFALGISYTAGYSQLFSRQFISIDLSPNYVHMYEVVTPARLSADIVIPRGRLEYSGSIDYAFWEQAETWKYSTLNYSIGLTYTMSGGDKIKGGLLSNNFPKGNEAFSYPYYEHGRTPFPYVCFSDKITEHVSIEVLATAKIIKKNDFLDRDILKIGIEYRK